MPQRTGLTLIELVVATTLAALLMLLIGGVLRSIARQQAWAVRQSRRAPATGILTEQLERDLANARSFRASGNTLRLEGLLAEDPQTHRPLQRPAEVVYRIERVTGRPCLVRTMVTVDNRAGRRTTRSILWLGAARLHAQRFDTPPLPASAVGDKPLAERDPDAMPVRAEVRIFDEGGRVLCHVHVVP